MKIYLVRYPEESPSPIDKELNYTPPALPEKLSLSSLSLSHDVPSKNDILLFYHTFITEDNTLQDVIFAYFQVARSVDGYIYPTKYLSFDKTRGGMGILNYSRKRVLTRYGDECSHWSLPEMLRCVNITYGKRNLASAFKQREGLRFFNSTTPCVSLSPIPSRASGRYYENALLEWVSSICENIRGEATRGFNTAKKGDTGVGKTGFVKYDYAPDSRGKIYCRLNHIVDKRNPKLCASCPMYKRKKGRCVCEWSLPVYDKQPYIPLTTADAFAYFDVLLEKGLVMDYRD